MDSSITEVNAIRFSTGLSSTVNTKIYRSYTSGANGTHDYYHLVSAAAQHLMPYVEVICNYVSELMDVWSLAPPWVPRSRSRLDLMPGTQKHYDVRCSACYKDAARLILRTPRKTAVLSSDKQVNSTQSSAFGVCCSVGHCMNPSLTRTPTNPKAAPLPLMFMVHLLRTLVHKRTRVKHVRSCMPPA